MTLPSPKTRLATPLGNLILSISSNKKIDVQTAEEINKLFCEVVIAPSYEKSSLEILKSKKVVKGNDVKKGEVLTLEKLVSLKLNDIFSIRTDSENLNETVEEMEVLFKAYIKDIKTKFEEKKSKIIRGHDLAPGVIKIVKVYLAIRRRNCRLNLD